MSLSNVTKSIFEIHIAVLLMAGVPLFAKLISLLAIDIIAIRSIIGAISLFIFIKITDVSLRVLTKKDFCIICITGILLSIHWVTCFHAIKISSVAVALISLYTYPILTVFMEPIFFHEKIHVRDAVAGIFVLIGIYLTVCGEGVGSSIMAGFIWGVISAFAYALRNIVYRRYLKSYPSSSIMFYLLVVSSVLLLPIIFIDSKDIFASKQWLHLFVLGVFFTATPHTILMRSLRYIKANTVGLIASVQPIYAILLAALILSEIPSLRTMIGGGIVIFTSAYATRKDNDL